ncbi:MAG TPA: bifunctional diaminohydroxyphosphoribosylaminopyrimidine deaminase/5-amino-6-(5-phosphoribosylamino)uracil reductase RibD [Actinomycetota bacterium]|nr:bifunctional diaminohydroxyphosphoribosylaminopyrimidine deaminase/5-amino-6-(5-phosphoribosylamino)uracil reductase RibD [Actinomycetota bacterium]
MALALRLARKGLATTSPNPAVGAVVVAGGGIVGTGWHRRPGAPHAEVVALQEAGQAARGATLYVTLEPCSHYGRTPPCVDAVLASGIARVVAAMTDPDPRVGGRGSAALTAAGVEVEVGVGRSGAEALSEAYLVHRREGRPFVTCKAAISADGGTAAVDRSSQWITGPAARRDAHRLRAASEAVCVGVGTVLADNPTLTPRGVRARRLPLRVVVESTARTPPGANVINGQAPTLIAVTHAAAAADLKALIAAGAEVLELPAERGRVALPGLLRALAERGVMSLLVEGGAHLAGSFAAQGLVDRYLLYVAPLFLGGDGLRVFEGWPIATIGEAPRLTLRAVRRIGEDLRVELRPRPQPTGG